MKRDKSPIPTTEKSPNRKRVSFTEPSQGDPTTRVVHSIRSGGHSNGERAWRIPVTICGVVVNAVVDTAAELTIISQNVYDKLPWRTELDFHNNVNLAGGGATMSVGFMGNVDLEIGDSKFSTPVYVAPLQDEMLLGIDFLQGNGVTLKCGSGLFQSEQGGVTRSMHKTPGNSPISAVTVSRVRLPPMSVKVVECLLPSELSEFILEPSTDIPPGVAIAKSFNAPGRRGKLCVMNLTPKGQVLKAGQHLAFAVPAVEVSAPNTTIREVKVGGMVKSLFTCNPYWRM